jgi:hypothetical protein
MDFGSGMAVDELVGLPAWQICSLALVNDHLCDVLQRAAALLVADGRPQFLLMEIWGDGHSVWHDENNHHVAQVTPTGGRRYTRTD